MIKGLFTIFAIGFLVFAVLGYHRAHTPEFKLACAAYQAQLAPMSKPDEVLCDTYWQLK